MDLNKRSRSCGIYSWKNEKIDMYDFPLPDCIQEQNGSPQFSSIVRHCKWPSLSRTIVEIQKFCYHCNLTSRFSLQLSLFLWVPLSFMMWTSFFRRPSKSSGHARSSFFVYSCPANLINLAVSFTHFKYRNHFCKHHATDVFCPITVTNWTIDVINILRELKPILCLSTWGVGTWCKHHIVVPH